MLFDHSIHINNFTNFSKFQFQALNTIYAYLIALSIVNVFFFLLTVWHIFQTNQEVIDRGENQRYIDRFNVEKQR